MARPTRGPTVVPWSVLPGLPVAVAGHACWRDRAGDVEVVFVGRGPRASREEVASLVAPNAPPLAWAEQCHSADVLTAVAGRAGCGDALIAAGVPLTLSVVTADCVPVLLATRTTLAAVHAGWRGIVAGVVPAALGRLEEGAMAWIGPAIGPCCYEVGADVAEWVAAAAGPEVVRPGRADRPHLDLGAAVANQLAAGGVREVRIADVCTRCEEERLWSYRREGRGAGRNLALIWRRRTS